MASCSYKLSRELIGHTDEVRSLAVFKDGSVVSASRDKTARFWRFDKGNYAESVVMKGHNDFVSSVCVIEPTEKNSTGHIITGSNDKNICIYYPGQEQPIHTLAAHTNTVYNLKASVVQKDVFLSCSLDTGKLWNLYELKQAFLTLLGHHESVVWCISDLFNGFLVTGGSDKTVIVYQRTGKVLHKLYGHLDCVRDIAAVSDADFLTCGNDAVTKHWNSISGVCLGTYSAHTSHIYSISSVFGGSLVTSCGEDKTIRVWRNQKVDQIISIPAQTVWSVKISHNEDIVCGSSDGIVRVFTIAEERFIDAERMQKYEQAVLDSIKESKQKKHNTNVTRLPRAMELNQPGEKDGDTVIVKEGNLVKVYRWSQGIFQWTLVGDVRKGEEKTSSKPKFNGVEYDYVFSVDIKQGAPLLKLPYNRGEDPYLAARRFLKYNKLSKKYLNQVANFIITNLQINPILNAEAQYQDPFTGGSRYISKNQPSTSRSSMCEPPPNDLTTSYIPQKSYLKLERGNITLMRKKFLEFNEKTDSAIQSVSSDKVESVIKLSNDAISDSASIEKDVTIFESLLNWPDELIYPILDIMRLLVLHEEANKKFCKEEIFHSLKRHIQKDVIVANQMLTYRILANLFTHETGEQFCLSHKDEILATICDSFVRGNKNNEVAVSTYILNLIVALNKTDDSKGKEQTLCVIAKMLEILTEPEALFRLLVGLGTIMLGPEKAGIVNLVIQSRPIVSSLKKILDASKDVPNKLVDVTRQIVKLIRN